MESQSRNASSCLCQSFNGHQRSTKSSKCRQNHQLAADGVGNLHTSFSVIPDVSSRFIPKTTNEEDSSLLLEPNPHKISDCENSTSCDKNSTPPSLKVRGPKLLKDSSVTTGQTYCSDVCSRSESDVSDRLHRLRIVQDSIDPPNSPETLQQSLPDPAADSEESPIDNSVVHEVVKPSSSSDELLNLIRTQNFASARSKSSTNGNTSRGGRVPRIKYNMTKDSCTVASSHERPIYPSLPYSPVCSPSSSPNLQRCEGQKTPSRPSPLHCPSGCTQLNQYKVLSEIGRGSFGVVKLAYNEEDSNYYAIKILSKRKLMKRAGLYGRIPPRRDGQKQQKSPLEQLSREIAILKKLNHENIVKLYEVLNESDGDNLYMVFELVEHGPVMQLPTKCPLPEEKAWHYFRDIIMGIEYLHFQKIIHRDIKPSNLLLSNRHRIQISDFGVCNQFEGVDAFLSDTSGTPAFVAPEALKGTRTRYSGKALDVWQMGVSLYSLVFGCVPYEDSNVLALYTKIRSNPLHFPPEPRVSDELKDLLGVMLEKDPDVRVKLEDVKRHVWVTKNDTCPLPQQEVDTVEVTEEEINNCMRPVPKLDTLVLIKSMLKKHSFSHPFKESLECEKYASYASRRNPKKTLRKITTCPNVPTYDTSLKQQSKNDDS